MRGLWLREWWLLRTDGRVMEMGEREVGDVMKNQVERNYSIFSQLMRLAHLNAHSMLAGFLFHLRTSQPAATNRQALSGRIMTTSSRQHNGLICRRLMDNFIKFGWWHLANGLVEKPCDRCLTLKTCLGATMKRLKVPTSTRVLAYSCRTCFTNSAKTSVRNARRLY